VTLAQVRSNFINSDEAKGLQQLGKWRGEYFNNRSLSGHSSFTRIDSEIENDWGNRSPGNGLDNNNFSVRWTGKFNFNGGDYLFHALADDGVRMWVDNNLIINQWNNHGATEYRAIQNLSGQHQVKVEYYENGGGAVAKAWWDKDAGDNTLSSARNLGTLNGKQSFSDFVGVGDPDDYYKFSFSGRSNFTVSLDWLNANANIDLIQDRNGNGVVDSGEIIQSSENSGNITEYLSQILEGGTYYLRARQSSSNSFYNLNFSGVELTTTFLVNDQNRALNIWRYDKTGRASLGIDANKETIVVIHGWKNSDQTDNIARLAKTASNKNPHAQVLAVDWGSIATQAGLDWGAIPYETAKWIAPVARWVKDELVNLGINADEISLFGHSLGSYVSSEIAGLFGKVENIVALDPATPGGIDGNYSGSYDIDGQTNGDQRARNFRDVANNSFAYVVSDRDAGDLGDNDKAATANDSFLMRFISTDNLYPWDTHGAVVDAFTNMIDRGLSFQPYQRNWYDKKGDKLSSPDFKYGHEGVIYASGSLSNWRVNSIVFVDSQGIERQSYWT
jgi:pimeloyl-ACP methyl ester carboxylesterase